MCAVRVVRRLTSVGVAVQNCFHVHDVSKRFEVKVKSVENLSKQLLYDANSFYGLDIEGDRVNVFVAFSLYFGEQLLAPVLHTQPVLPSQPIWEDWLVTELLSMEVTATHTTHTQHTRNTRHTRHNTRHTHDTHTPRSAWRT